MDETPIELARRVWPGEWQQDDSAHGIAIRPSSPIGLCVRASLSHHNGYWYVNFGTPSMWIDGSRSVSLEVALIETRDKVQAAVAVIARAVGLEVSGG
jgi:hypothetical protein